MLRRISPIHFAMAMSTGIVSTAAQLLGFSLLANLLFWVNLVVYVVVCAATLIRAAVDTRRFFSDMIDHRQGPVYFTSVAASSLLGSQLVVVLHNYAAATALWVLSILLWIGLTYTVFTGFTVKEIKPTLAEGISGAWLLAVVSTQAIAVLSALLSTHWQQPFRQEVNFLALSMWLWGGMLYIWMISLIFYRYTFFTFSPDDLAPPYWINTGAMAISALAGSLLILDARTAPLLQSLLPFLKGFTVFFWATGSWWIPMLVILAFWRHGYKRFPLRYDAQYWGAVFPVGMYTAATYRMGQALGLDFLFQLSHGFIYAAFAAWTLTFLLLVAALSAAAFRPRSRPRPVGDLS